MKQLPQYKISRRLYDLIINSFRTELVNDINPYRNGYKDKALCIVVPQHYIICEGGSLNYLLNYQFESDIFTDWKQYVLVLDEDQEQDVAGDFTPHICKKIITDKLNKCGLSNEDIDKRLHEYEADYCEALAQQHYLFAEPGIIQRFDNCIYYDINKAHSDAIGEIFPEIKGWLEEIAMLAKIDKRWKSVPNYYVGMLAYKTKSMRQKQEQGQYEKTYNWIVQRTTKILTKRLDEVSDINSNVVYTNTDGIVIQNPTKIIPGSNRFGDFKVETDETTFYTYAGDNYSIVQYGDTIKGNLPMDLRKFVDLREGKVISFDRKLNENGIFEYTNIQTKYIKTEVIE